MKTRTRLVGGGASAVVAAALAFGSGAAVGQSSAPAGSAGAAGPVDPGVAAIIAWNQITDGAAIGVAKQPPPWSALTAGLVQAAVYDAVIAITGGYAPYLPGLAAQPDASVEAAVAAAAHDVLVHYLPDQAADLDGKYATATAAIEEGPAKTAGVTLGQAAASALIASREGDGLAADVGFVMPSPAPGVWQLPPDAKPLMPWMARMRPFMLTAADQFLPGPPPDLASEEWATEFNETKALGGKDSTERTPEQTLIAQFYSAPAVAQYNTAFEKVITDHGLGAADAARLYALGNMVGADALTACMNAKYQYEFWRPAFAVPGAADDGNDATEPDPAWEPLLATPTHPEYPSNHGCYTSSQAAVLASVLGTKDIDLTLGSSVTADTLPTLHYATVDDLVTEIINARIWGGLHFRGSDETGVALGNKVADYALANFLAPTK